MRKPTLTTVAREAGVSVPTVSQVMRGTGRISDETRKKVLKAASKLRYIPDARAASMRSGQNREVGFVVNQISNPFNAEVISGVSDLLESEGYLVSILDARDDLRRQNSHLESFIRNGRGGLLWVPAVETPDDTYELLETHKIPVVTFMRRSTLNRFDHVGIRNSEATAVATRHLADLGHSNIAYLGGTAMTDVRLERIAGYSQVMKERSLGPTIVWDSADNKPAGLVAMNELRNAHPGVTGVVCNGDMVALGACLALTEAGLQPGVDMSVIGLDDIEDAAIAKPALTTMAICPYQLGRRLALTLINRINEPEIPATLTEVPAVLTVRETTRSQLY